MLVQHLEKLDDFNYKFKIGNYYLNKWHFRGLINYYIDLAMKGQMKVGFKELLTILASKKFDNYSDKVAEYFDLRINDLLGNKRPKNIAQPRMIAMYLAREMTDYSLPEIGEAFGGRTHATVINAVNKIRKDRSKDKKIDHSISLIQRQLHFIGKFSQRLGNGGQIENLGHCFRQR